MKTSHLVLAALASAVLSAGSAVASDVKIVQPPEFGRDGAPRVTVASRVSPDAVHVQAFGRDVPATRVGKSAPQPFASDTPARISERFGRS